MIAPSGEVRYAEEGRNLPLGVDVDLPLEAGDLSLAPGSLVVLYTDGLVERADQSARVRDHQQPDPQYGIADSQ